MFAKISAPSLFNVMSSAPSSASGVTVKFPAPSDSTLTLAAPPVTLKSNSSAASTPSPTVISVPSANENFCAAGSNVTAPLLTLSFPSNSVISFCLSVNCKPPSFAPGVNISLSSVNAIPNVAASVAVAFNS